MGRGIGWVVFNTCMQMHSGYVRLELVQSIALDGACEVHSAKLGRFSCSPSWLPLLAFPS